MEANTGIQKEQPDLSPTDEMKTLTSQEELTSADQHLDQSQIDMSDMITSETLTGAVTPIGVESPLDPNHVCFYGLLSVQEGGDSDATGGDIQLGEGGNGIGRWSAVGHEKLMRGLGLYGKDWRRISNIVPSSLCGHV